MAVDNSLPAAVSVSLQQLKDESVPLSTLEEAFGPSSLGIIIVTGLPDGYPELRARLLSYSSYLASLPTEELSKTEKPQAKYSVGWSCGKETLADGRYDTFKGSYYAQPMHDAELETKARELYPHVPEFTSENVWPADTALPHFARIFEDLCRLIVDVAGYVARNCDRYGVARIDDYQPGTLERIVRGSVSTKARLLHYFPPRSPPSTHEKKADDVAHDDDDDDDDDDGWCALHRDLGALTGLTAGMFIDESAHPPAHQLPTSASASPASPLPLLPELQSHPDPRAGLWIQSRAGAAVQVRIPRDALAFQTGEALELLTRGRFRAVPHFVRAARAEAGAIARNTLAVFTQPNLWEKVDGERDFAAFGAEVLGRGV